MKVTIVTPEFSRPLEIEKLSPAGFEIKIKADPKECKRLAERFAILDVQSLEAHLKARLTNAEQIIKITGEWKAHVTQQCVVSLDPLPAHLKQPVDASYLAPGKTVEMVGLADDDTLEAVIAGVIDLGELVSQLMGAALDPYPRKKGIPLVAVEFGDQGPSPGPLAKLVEFKKPKD